MKVICALLLFVSLGHARDTKNLNLSKDSRETCVEPTMEWIEKGPVCDVFCDHQPELFSGGPHQHKQCQASMYDAIHDILNNAEDPLKNFVNGEPDLDRIAENVTKTVRTWGSYRLYVNDPESYEGCYCKLGYARYGDDCVAIKDCPISPFSEVPIGRSELCHGTNEEFHTVGEHCEVYCEIQPLRYGRASGSINSCGKTGDFVRAFLPEIDEYKNVFDSPRLLEKYAENITEGFRNLNKETFSDGCYCSKGYARYGYRCIKLEQCPTRKCTSGEFFKIDGPVCEATCQNLQYHHKITVKGQKNTMPGCFCQGGKVRDERGSCIEPMKCWNYNQNLIRPDPQEYHYHYADTVEEAIKDAQRIQEQTQGAVSPVIQTVVDTESGPSTVNLRLGSNSRVPESPFNTGERPIYNRLQPILTEEASPVVDGFKKEPVPVVPVVSSEVETKPVVKTEEPKVTVAKEKVVVVEEQMIPVVAVYE